MASNDWLSERPLATTVVAACCLLPLVFLVLLLLLLRPPAADAGANVRRKARVHDAEKHKVKHSMSP